MVILTCHNQFICRFTTPKEAEAYYKKQESQPQSNSGCTPHKATKSSNIQTNPVDFYILLDMLNQMPEESSLPVLSELFSTFLSIKFALSVPKDFLCLAASAMVRLSEAGRTNVLYNLAKGIGTMRPDTNISRFPVMRMPMGLVEYTAHFFAVDNLQQVRNVQLY